MSVREVEGPAGAPWERPMHGTLDRLVVESELLADKSSGGYGAMVVPMQRPDVFGALASHAGDALFEACYLPDFRAVARTLRDDFEGSYDVFFERLAATDHLTDTLSKPLETYGYAAAYSPDPA